MKWPFIAMLLLFSAGATAEDFPSQLSAAAIERTQHRVIYDGAYVAIAYPGGDVPADRGVCTDVIIRAYRALGVDLQVLVHEDMQANFDRYPSRRMWGLTRPDANIDHRRVPNLQTFFTRNGESLTVSRDAADYRAGDIVTWMLPGNLPHIGIVTYRTSHTTGRPLIVHNIGAGPVLEDMLFAYPVTGHYRFSGNGERGTGNGERGTGDGERERIIESSIIESSVIGKMQKKFDN